MGFSVRVIGKRGTNLFVALFFPLAFLVAMTVISGEVVIAEDRGDPTPPPEGDWNITEDTTLDGMDITVSGNINVTSDVHLKIRNSTLRVMRDFPGQYTLLLMEGCSLVVENSTLHLDSFESWQSSSISITRDSVVSTTGRFLAGSNEFHAEWSTIENIASAGDSDEPGGDAIMHITPKDDSELRNMTIRNYGGHAGITSPGMNGSEGGSSAFLCTATTIFDTLIDCRAGDSRGGGLGLTRLSGGNGGKGPNAVVDLTVTFMEGVEVTARGGDGGIGARGADNHDGDGGHGGFGGAGGNALIRLVSPDPLRMFRMSNCSFIATAGTGGSAGNGGSAINGTGGNGRTGADGGNATVQIHCPGDIAIQNVTLTSRSGQGGYGGDYGRHEGGTGSFGPTAEGGDGGSSLVEVLGDGRLNATDMTISSKGGNGLDGGGGYEQGERGGDGGDATILVIMNRTINATEVDLEAVAGNGGNGGPAFSDINGDGGDGGDTVIIFTGLEEMDVRDFSIFVIEGEGGRGRTPSYDGYTGIPTLDIETQLLRLTDGVLNMPLDDLSGNAVGYLYNVEFDMNIVHPPVLPIGDAIVYQWYPVTVTVVDNPDPSKANVLEDYTVAVIHIETGAIVDSKVTDENGRCRFHLNSFVYTSYSVDYVGSYFLLATTPDRKTTKMVKIEVQKPLTVTISIYSSHPHPHIQVIDPEDDTLVVGYSWDETLLEVKGMINYQEGDIFNATIHLYPEDADPSDWPVIWLEKVETPPIPPIRPMVLHGRFYPPEDGRSQWTFNITYPLFSYVPALYNGSYVLVVNVTTDYGEYTSESSFDLVLDPNVGRPWVQVSTPIDGRELGEVIVLRVQGAAGDDYNLSRVEVRIDGGGWTAVTGLEEWFFDLDIIELLDGEHMITLRSFDGVRFSELDVHSFTVNRSTSNGGNGNGGGGSTPDDDMFIYIIAGLLLLVAGIILLVGVAILKTRRRPDS